MQIGTEKHLQIKNLSSQFKQELLSEYIRDEHLISTNFLTPLVQV